MLKRLKIKYQIYQKKNLTDEDDYFNPIDDVDTMSKELLDLWTDNDIVIVYNML